MGGGFSSSKPSASSSDPRPVNKNSSELSKSIDKAQSQKAAINSWDNRNKPKDSPSSSYGTAAVAGGAIAASGYNSNSATTYSSSRSSQEAQRQREHEDEIARVRREERDRNYSSNNSNYSQPTNNGGGGMSDVLTGIMIGRMTAPQQSPSWNIDQQKNFPGQTPQTSQGRPSSASEKEQSTGFFGWFMIVLLLGGLGVGGWFIYQKYWNKQVKSNYNLDD